MDWNATEIIFSFSHYSVVNVICNGMLKCKPSKKVFCYFMGLLDTTKLTESFDLQKFFLNTALIVATLLV